MLLVILFKASVRLHPKNNYLMISAVLIKKGCANYAGIIESTMKGACDYFSSIL